MCEIHTTFSFLLQNVRDRIGSVLTNIYLSDIEYPDRKEKCNKRNPDIATFMAEVSEFGFQWRPLVRSSDVRSFRM